MKPGMEVITSDGRRVGHIGPPSADGGVHLARSDKTIPSMWVARVDVDVILRKTLKQITDRWGAEPDPAIIQGGKQTT